MADYVDSNGKSKECWLCKKPMRYMGQHGYQKYWDCDDDCGPECEDVRPVKSTPCWVVGCTGKFDRLNENADPPYGHRCPQCGCSLRNHPEYGMGGKKDRRWTNAYVG